MARVKQTDSATAVADAPETPAGDLQTSANSPAAQYREIPLADLRESGTNPRKHFDAKALGELADSIRSKGILEPILVRPGHLNGAAPDRDGYSPADAGGYEIVAGHRRFRAALLAKLETAPCLVRQYSNVEALEIQVVENGQRVDVPAIEEAEGYKLLMKAAEYDVETLAAKVGKSASYVYQRLKLCALIGAAKELLAAGHLTAGHAILIARLQPRDQVRALCYSFNYYDEKNPQATLDSMMKDFGGDAQADMRAHGVRSLAEWIEMEVHCDLSESKFDKNDEQLVPEAGSCLACPKRTINSPDRFEREEDRCTDPACFKSKCEAFVAAKVEQVAEKLDEGEKVLRVSSDYSRAGKGVLTAQSYEVVKKGDKGAQPAVDIDTGAVKYVKVRPRASSGPREKGMSPEECAAQQRKLDEKFKMESLRRRLIWQALCCCVPPTLDESHLIGAAKRYVPYDKKDRELFSAAVFGRGKKELDRNKVDKLSFDELQRVIVFGELFDGVHCQSEWDLDRKNHRTAPLFAAAKRFKLDMDAIEEQVKSEISGSMPVPAEAKTPSKAKVKKAKKKKK